MNSDLIINTSNYPFSVGWAITNKCNLHCIHCNMNSGSALENELTKEECFRIIDELSFNNVQKICFFGGEPLVRNDFFEIANYAGKKGIFVSFTTNGLLIDENMIDNELYKFELIRVSLDGPTPETHEFIRNLKGCFDITVNNVKKMTEKGISVGIVTCISHKNINYIEEMISFLETLKIKRWFIPILSAAGRGSNIEKEILTPEEVKQLLIKLEKIAIDIDFSINLDLPYSTLLKDKNNKIKASCPAATTELAIFANGDVSPCCEIPIMGGNLRTKSISEIWNKSKVFVDFRNRNLIKGKCKNCKYIKNCGGCRANAYIKYGDYMQGDDVCWKE
ncbi:MAG: radical SAM protein [Clostridia bacterium]|nr:radical SAM protein [Clostridia bacterium]